MSHTHEAVQKAGPGMGLCWTVRRLQPNLRGAPEQAGLLPGARVKHRDQVLVPSGLPCIASPLGRVFDLGQGGSAQTRSLAELRALLSQHSWHRRHNW